jgi:hypothetical protein
MTKGRHVDGKSDSHGDGPFRSRVAGDWYAWAAFEPAGGRTAFPGFDAPRFKPPFTLPIRSTVLLEGFASLAHHADAGVAGKPPPSIPLTVYRPSRPGCTLTISLMPGLSMTGWSKAARARSI